MMPELGLSEPVEIEPLNLPDPPPPPPPPPLADVGSVDGQPSEEIATGTSAPTRTRCSNADGEANTSVAPAAPDTLRRPKRMGRYASNCASLMHRVAALLKLPESPKHDTSLQMLQVDCHICLEQLSTLQTDINRTKKTLRRIQRRADWRVRGYPDWENPSSRTSCFSNPSIQVAPPPSLPNYMTDPLIDSDHAGYALPPSSLPIHMPVLRSYEYRPPPNYIPKPPIDSSLDDTPTNTDRTRRRRATLEVPDVYLYAGRSRLSIDHAFEDLPSVDDLVRRWTNVRSDDMDAELEANPSSDDQVAVE
jgi:hypothetical protein